MGDKEKTLSEAVRETLGKRKRPPPKPWICRHCGDRVEGKARKCPECGTSKYRLS